MVKVTSVDTYFDVLFIIDCYFLIKFPHEKPRTIFIDKLSVHSFKHTHFQEQIILLVL
jgi:hypothetical protein